MVIGMHKILHDFPTPEWEREWKTPSWISKKTKKLCEP